MTRIFAVSLLASGGVGCFVLAWFENRRWTRYLDDLGVSYHCKRWPGETNNHYHMRLQARIGFR